MKTLLRTSLGALLGGVFWCLDWVVPKDRTRVLCLSDAGKLFGNAKAIYDHIQAHDECGLTAVRYRHDGGSNDPSLLGGWWRLRTWWGMLRVKTVVTTHSCHVWPFLFSGRKLFVETWHGLPLKGQRYTETGLALSEPTRGDRWWRKTLDIFIAPSRFAGYAMCASCLLNPRKIAYLGQARNDVLLRPMENENFLRELFPDAPAFSKAILYCPTYRRSAPMRFFPFEDMEMERLEAVLEAHDAILFTRGHSYGQQEGPQTSGRIMELGQDRCIEVNDALGAIDVLITDYSSIYIDYLLLDRPIVFVPYDLDEYRQECGFVVDDYDYWTPGEKVLTQEEFLHALQSALDAPEAHSAKRKEINALFNAHQDGQSCEKTVELIRQRV